MKKTLIILAAVMVFTSANAQDEKWYGSKEGGFAITMNANPIINYVGNMFNGYAQGNSLEEFNGIDSFTGGNTITGKYFLKDNLALDLGFGINNNYNVRNNYDNTDAAADQEKVLNYRRTATTAFHAKVGAEYRLQPGKRLQPIFGAAIIYQHTNDWNFTKDLEGDTKDKTTYDNTISAAGGASNLIGLTFNVGVEYFIIPQISLGANLDLGIGKRWTKGCKENEKLSDNKLENYSRIDLKETNFSTAKVGANVTLNFYF